MKISYTSMTRQFATRETGSWRTEKPVVEQEICIACQRCVQYCPEGIVRLRENAVFIDYTFCKGCGICAYECKQEAISMVSEQ